MATTITKMFANPFRLRYKILTDADGFADQIFCNNSSFPEDHDVATESVPGPLRDFFLSLVGLTEEGLGDALFADGHFAIEVQSVVKPTGKLVAAPFFSFDTHVLDGSPTFTPCVFNNVDTAEGYVDFVYHHSLPG